MKKIIAIGILIGLTLTGCSNSGTETDQGAGENVTPPAATTEENTQKEYTLQEQEALNGILDQIKNFEQGTAGSSLKIVILAADILNMDKELLQQDFLEKQVSDYKAGLDSQTLEQFGQTVNQLEQTIPGMLEKTPESLKLMDTAGVTPPENGLSSEQWNMFLEALKK